MRMKTPIIFSRGRNTEDNHPRLRIADSMQAMLLQLDRDRAPHKGLAYFCAGFNSTGRRCKEGVLPARFLTIDIDRIAPERWPDVRTWFMKYSGGGWPTHSSVPEAPRERILLEIDRAVTREERLRIGARIQRDLEDEFGDAIYIDSSTFRPEQPNFNPPTGVTIARFEGDPIDADVWLANAPPANEPVCPKARIEEAFADDPVLNHLRSRSLVRQKTPEGKVWIHCPFESAHTQPAEPFGTVYYVAHTNGFRAGHFHCLHSHCAKRTDVEFMQAIGFHKAAPEALEPAVENVSLADFYAYLPMHQYIFVPTRELWPASSVNKKIDLGARFRASDVLDRDRAVAQMTWVPGRDTIIADELVSHGGWIAQPGYSTFNLYRPPSPSNGNAKDIKPWLDQIEGMFGAESEHLLNWFAHRAQHPGDKINHALVLGGCQGIGKDTILEPLKQAIGPWNFAEVSPVQLLGRFNSYVKSVVLRVSEARDLGDVDRYGFYEHLKALTASPPDVLRCDEKNIREHSVMNCMGVIITTNHKSDGIFLPADDRRHFVAWSDLTKEEFEPDYWLRLYKWYAAGGINNVSTFLRTRDLSGFDSKAPPPHTEAWHEIVNANRAPEDAELADVLDLCAWPDALTLEQLTTAARGIPGSTFGQYLTERKNRRVIPHRLQSANYVQVRNEAAASGLWNIRGTRQAVYARQTLSVRDRIMAARKLIG